MMGCNAARFIQGIHFLSFLLNKKIIEHFKKKKKFKWHQNEMKTTPRLMKNSISLTMD